jgi:hypothetical protein
MQGYRCNVTGSTSHGPLAKPQPPVWCEGAPNNCTKGAKQIMSWNQLTGNNIAVTGFDQAGDHKSPAYNMKCGFANGEFVSRFFPLLSLFFLRMKFFVFLLMGRDRCPK